MQSFAETLKPAWSLPRWMFTTLKQYGYDVQRIHGVSWTHYQETQGLARRELHRNSTADRRETPGLQGTQQRPKINSKERFTKERAQHHSAKIREMQNFWLSKQADEIQGFTDMNEMMNFYDGLKEVYCPT